MVMVPVVVVLRPMISGFVHHFFNGFDHTDSKYIIKLVRSHILHLNQKSENG